MEMTKKVYFFVILPLVLSGAVIITGSSIFQCPIGTLTTFEKCIGLRPGNDTSLVGAAFSFSAGDAPGVHWSTLECVRKCKGLSTCHGVLVLQRGSLCVGLPAPPKGPFTADSDSTFFVKICADVPESCRNKLWITESSAGYRLLARDSQLRTLENITSEQCSSLLVRLSPENGSPQARSAQFMLPQRDGDRYIFDGNDIENTPSATGTCVVNAENKFTQPESFRVANGETLYKENQCVEDFPKQIDRCSYEEYYNQTLKHYDVIIYDTTTTECKKRCETEYQFNCRGFTIVPPATGVNQHSPLQNNGGVERKTCLLHSEDILNHGSWLLTKLNDAVYYRRVVCLNITVECTPSAMTVTYYPRSEFLGRFYVSGFSETCSTEGRGKGQPTRLVVPFQSNSCGVNRAYALGDGDTIDQNKTLMYTLLVVQNNPIIQAQGDRFVRAGCVAAPAQNITLGAAISVGSDSDGKDTPEDGKGSSANPPASSIINTQGSVRLPQVRMYIVNEPEQEDQRSEIAHGAVSLGETIELRIEADTSQQANVDIHAYHLVASSQLGDSSVLLLDGRGCPAGQADFPPLRRFSAPGVVRLAARFKAFRFPNSHVVKFSVMVQYCAGPCPQVACDDLRSARRGRSSNATGDLESNQTSKTASSGELQDDYETPDDANASQIEDKWSRIVVASSETGGHVRRLCQEMRESNESKVPLELSLVVASNDVFTADSLIYGENNRILVGGIEEPPRTSPNMICIHEAIFITVTFVWLLIQILILAGCMMVIKRYRSFAEDNQYHKDYQSFDNLGFDSFSTNRRVHWPDQNVDILHAM